MGESENPMLAIVDRLGRLEGLITGLQASITQSHASTAAFMTRVERLEQRQVELERNMVTADDIKSLAQKVDSLVTSDASRRGGADVAKWSITQVLAFGALLTAVISLIGVGFNREAIQQQEQTQQEQKQ
jgi:hypothetical protein